MSGTRRVAAEGCSSASPRDAGGNSDWSRTDLHGTSDLFIQLRQPETLHRNCSHLLSSQPEEGWMSLVLIPMVFPAKMTIILILRGGELLACFVRPSLHQPQDSYTSRTISFVTGF